MVEYASMPNWNKDDAVLGLSIFGTEEPVRAADLIAEWLATQIGSSLDRFLSFEMSIGAAIGVRLTDGSDLFLKILPGSQDVAALSAQVRLQEALANRGFPAPDILLEPRRLGPGYAVAMVFDQSGVPTDVRIPSVRDAMARCLSKLVREATDLEGIDGLPERHLPTRADIWPMPHNALFDFVATQTGAEWIDDLARDALRKLADADSRMVVGHHDWSAKNMRMGETEIAVVYDWDAVFRDRETAFVGSAAAHFPVTWELPVPQTPTRQEMSAFLEAYRTARGSPFTSQERHEIAAYATYSRAYKARCEHCLDQAKQRWIGSSREALALHGPYTPVSLQI